MTKALSIGDRGLTLTLLGFREAETVQYFLLQVSGVITLVSMVRQEQAPRIGLT